MHDRFCRHCGTRHLKTFGAPPGAPQACHACDRTTFHNPLPVAVILQPMIDFDGGRVGVLIGRRAGAVMKAGEWGLPGGFIDLADADVVSAAYRELREETGFAGGPHPHPSKAPAIVASVNDGRHLVIFVEARDRLPMEQLHDFIACDECDAVRIAWAPEPLAFPSHSDALAGWFKRRAIERLPVSAAPPR